MAPLALSFIRNAFATACQCVLEEPVKWDLVARDVTCWGIAGPEWSYSLLVLC